MSQAALDAALRDHSAGRLNEAIEQYRRMLQQNSDHPAALHLMGVALSQQGDKPAAIAFISRAIEKNPNIADFHSNLALAYLENGEPEQAVASGRRALSLNGEHPDALNNLGNALKQLGNLPESMECYRRALAIRPDFTVAMSNMADTLRKLGRPAEAEALLERILSLRPNDNVALAAHAEALLRAGKFDQAGEVFQKIIGLWPNDWLGYNGLGVAKNRAGKLDEATALYQKAIALSPNLPAPWNNLGYARVAQGRVDEGIHCYQRAIAARSDFADAHNNLANAYFAKLELDAARGEYEKTLYFAPDHADGHWNRALLSLLKGDFARGWLEYEWRWLKFSEFRRSFSAPLWDGGDIAGKTILLHAEQGLGDTIQFVRLAPFVAERRATVNLECQRELAALMQHVPGVARTIARGDKLPPFDVHCPLLSLPRALGLTPDSIPATTPYLSVDPNLRQRWENRLRPHEGLRVGLVWAGAALHPRDAERSIEAAALLPLARVPDVRLFSLQKRGGPRSAPDARLQLIDFTADLHDFAETAALLSNLDVVIGVDTSVLHLAGALGRPTWALLPYAPDWRWMLHREDCPWYPTMRLFRQPRPGDWAAVIGRVAGELRELVEASK